MTELAGRGRHWLLLLLPARYLVGETSHFLLSSTSRDVAREVGYGDLACGGGPGCGALLEEEECRAAGCSWHHSGLGIQYQV